MLKRTFFRAHHSEEEPRGALSVESLKLLDYEFYLVRQSEYGSGAAASQSDETLSSSSTVLSTTDQ